MHHCSVTKASFEGFSLFPDITLAVRQLRKYFNIERVMIIDLDANHGDGISRDFLGDEHVYIIDFYNTDVFPKNKPHSKAISSEYVVTKQDTDETCNSEVRRRLSEGIEKFKPQYVIYNAGTDILAGDIVGQLNISHDGVIQRDQTVFELTRAANLPLLFLLSGGAQHRNAPTIADSIVNLYDKFDLKHSSKK